MKENIITFLLIIFFNPIIIIVFLVWVAAWGESFTDEERKRWSPPWNFEL